MRVSSLHLVLFAAGISITSCSPKDAAPDTAHAPPSASPTDAAHTNDLEALNREGVRLEKLQKTAEALACYERGTQQNHAKCRFNLGRLILAVNNANAAERARAVALIETAAAQQLAAADLMLGHMYSLGYEKSQDTDTAMVWWRKAAELGSVEAKSLLGEIYFKRGADKEALELLQPAADAGVPEACNNFALMLAAGRGGPQDRARAFRYMERAAKSGYAKAQANLGDFYRNGFGVQPDRSKALEFYKMAASQGSADGAWGLGIMASNDNNFPAAIEHYKAGAAKGHTPSLYNLALLMHEGRGTPVDRVNAYALLLMAAAYSTDAAKTEQSLQTARMVARSLTAAQIATASKSGEDAMARQKTELIGYYAAESTSAFTRDVRPAE